MAFRELQAELPCLKVSSSGKGSACSLKAPAEPVALIDILQTAPKAAVTVPQDNGNIVIDLQSAALRYA